MEEGLFSRLQGYFDASYGGRYVEYLVKESIEEQPKLAGLLFGVKSFDQLYVEYPFKVDNRSRIADMAFLDKLTQQPRCLIELKYDDHKNPGNAGQVDDYLKFCKEKECKFILLSQHHLPRELRAKLPRKDSRLLFSDIAEKLKGNEDSIAGMLRRFFVDRGLVMHNFEKRDQANLKSFVFRMFTPWGGQGRSHSKDAMGGGAAEAFGHLLKNMNIVAREVANRESGRAPTIDFHVDPWVNPKRIQKEAIENPDDESVSAWDAKAGGRLSG